VPVLVGGKRDTYCPYCWILLKALESQQIPDYRGKDGKLQKRANKQTVKEANISNQKASSKVYCLKAGRLRMSVPKTCKQWDL